MPPGSYFGCINARSKVLHTRNITARMYRGKHENRKWERERGHEPGYASYLGGKEGTCHFCFFDMKGSTGTCFESIALFEELGRFANLDSTHSLHRVTTQTMTKSRSEEGMQEVH